MTRFIWDKFSKDLIETLLSPYGQVIVSKEITSEVQKIDLWFSPHHPNLSETLGLLGKLSQIPCLFEPYRNPITQEDILDCLDKRLTVRGQLRREAKKKKQRISNNEIPFVWILTPTVSYRVLNSFAGHLSDEYGKGVYILAESLKVGVVVIHQLAETPETLWLRLLGRGRKREKAISELEGMSSQNPLKSETLELLYNVTRNLEATSTQIQEDREFIMRLAPLYQQEKEQAIQQGEQRGEQRGEHKEALKLVFRLLQRRFGEIPQDVEETIRQLSVERLEDLGLALLDFESQSDLITWLS